MNISDVAPTPPTPIYDGSYVTIVTADGQRLIQVQWSYDNCRGTDVRMALSLPYDEKAKNILDKVWGADGIERFSVLLRYAEGLINGS